MGDQLLIQRRNEEIVALTRELNELRELQELVGHLVATQEPHLEKSETAVTTTQVEVEDGTKKIERVYQSWWSCWIL